MKKFFILLQIFIFIGIKLSMAQSPINAGADTSICLPGSVNLQATLGSLSPTILSSFPLSALPDDGFSPLVINIGFSFTYFGNTYTQCAVSTNNYISFNTSNAGAFSPWSIGQPVPGGPATVFNAILGPWQDIQPSVGGTIRYATVGTAPNRIFAVEYCSVPMFSCNSMQFSSQIQLHENGNIETHIISKPICSTWNGGQAIHAIQDASGTVAFVYNGRNAGVQWSAYNEGTRFEPDPNDPNNYFVYSVPFQPIAMGVNGTVTWSQVGGSTVGTGLSVNVSPTAPTAYVASISDLCSGFTFTDTVQVNAAPTPDLSYTYPSATFCAGSTNVTPTLGTGSVGDFTSTPAGLVINPTTGEIDLAASTPGTYTIKRYGSNPGGCVDTLSIQINITNAPNPNYTYSNNVYCAGGTNPTPIFDSIASAGLFTSVPSGLVFVNANSGVVDVANSAPGTYTVTNTITGFGCPTTTDTSTIVIAEQVVNAGPPISACTGAGILLQGIATGPNSGNVSWSGGSGVFTSPNNDTTYYNPALNDAGLPYVNLVLTMTGTPTCPTVFSIVPVTIEMGATAEAGNDVTYCGTNSSPIILNGTVGGLASSGNWSTNGTGTFGNSSSLSTVYTPSSDDLNNGGVVLYLISNNPGGSCPAAIDSVVVTYAEQPTVSIQMQSVVCAGSSITLSAVSTGTVNSYLWSSVVGTGTFSSTTGASVQYTPSAADIANGTITFSLEGVAPAPCTNATATGTIQIIPAPTAQFSGGGVVQTGTGTICPNGTSVPVTINLSGGGPFNITYAVGGDTLTVNNITSSPFVYQDSIPGAFTLVSITDTGACPGIITGTATVDTVNLRYSALARAEVCGEHDGVAKVINPVGGNQPYTYLWNNAATTDSITGLTTGTYTVTITDANNCYSTQDVFVPQVLGVVASMTADPMSGSYPLTVNFTNNSTGATTYMWNFGDNDSSDVTSPSHVFTAQGSYQVILTAYNTSECFISDTLTIIVDGEVPNIFTPNRDGKNDKFMINKLSAKNFTAQIYNRWGRKVFEWTDPKEGWDGANSEAGVYYYIVNYTTLTGVSEEMHGTITLMK